MNDKLKIELISAGNTFIAVFISTVAATIGATSIEWSSVFWISLGLAAVRAGIKAVLNKFIVPIHLGGAR